MTARYIATTGSDANNGTSPATPKLTFNATNALAAAGDVIHVAPGIYYQTPLLSTSGTSGSRITWISDTPWGAKIIALADSGTGNNACVELSGNYITFQGFDVTPGSSNTNRIGIMSSGHTGFNFIWSNHVHDISRAVINAAGGNGGSGILLDWFTGSNTPPFASDCQAIGNVVHDIGWDGTSSSLAFNIYVAQGNSIVQNNILFRGPGFGVQTWHAGTAMVCSNNLIFGCLGGGVVIGAGDAPAPTTVTSSANCKINNNEILFCGIGIHAFGATGSGNTYTNNLLFGNTTNISSAATSAGTASGTITSDPLMVDYTADPGVWWGPTNPSVGDFHLTATSPARGAGTTSNAPTTDYEGVARATNDIGPFAYNSAAGGSNSATVTWTTDVGADTKLEYWVTGQAHSFAPATGHTQSDQARVTSHSVTLNNLTGSTYNLLAHARNLAGTESVSSVLTFTPAAAGSNVSVTWTTDKPASTWFEYGNAGGASGVYSHIAPADQPWWVDPLRVTSHSVTLTGLVAGTYHGRAHGRDLAGVEGVSSDFVFSAGAAPTGTTMRVLVIG